VWHLRRVPDPLPAGADAVVPPRVSPLASALRLVLLRLRARGRLRAGRGILVARGARVAVAPGGSVRLGDECVLAPGCRIEAAGGAVRIGAGARLGERSVIVALDEVTVGDGASIGAWGMVSDAAPGFADVEAPVRVQPLAPRPVRIGPGARVGAHAAVLAGAVLRPGEVKGSYSVTGAEVGSAPRVSSP
jgi:acetyltransferase-like isoleucine patch superfamily enzyme